MNQEEKSQIAAVKTDVEWLKKEVKENTDNIKEIRRWVSNEIPHQIKEVKGALEEKIDEMRKEGQNKLPVWVTILFSLFSAIIVGLAIYIITH